jgi:ribosomal protein L11 methyltransferase
MGFGTGHHATTRLCLDALQHVDVHRRRVIDVGTGSGLLAIAAARLGAATVVAIDDDADAIQSATENVTLNGGVEVALRVADFRSDTPASAEVGSLCDPTSQCWLGGPQKRSALAGRRSAEREGWLGRFDIVIANLTGGLLISAAAALRALGASDARLILSGFLVSEEDAVTAAIGGHVERRSCEDEWLCVTVSP